MSFRVRLVGPTSLFTLCLESCCAIANSYAIGPSAIDGCQLTDGRMPTFIDHFYVLIFFYRTVI